MRKLSLNDGRLSLDIMPDCGGGVSALRWITPMGEPLDLLSPVNTAQASQCAMAQMACAPLLFFDGGSSEAQAAAWTVQDASNVRATLTLHQESLNRIYQILLRFELSPKGLQMQMTLTNIGVQPLPAGIGLQLRLGDGASAAQGALARQTPPDPMQVWGHVLAQELLFEWPQKQLALVLLPEMGFAFVMIDTSAEAVQENTGENIGIILRSHADETGLRLLKQGDSLTAKLLLSVRAGEVDF